MPLFDVIDAKRLEELQDDDAVVLNVLGEESFSRQHIPGSKNAPEGADDFADRIQDLVPDRGTHVVVYCQDEDCSASPRAAKKLVEMGYENVYDFEAGIQGWKESGRDVEGKTQQIRAEVG